MKTFFRNTLLAVLAVAPASQLVSNTIVTGINNKMKNSVHVTTSEGQTRRTPVAANATSGVELPLKDHNITIATPTGVAYIEQAGQDAAGVRFIPFSGQESKSVVQSPKVRLVVTDDGYVTIEKQ